MSTPEEKRSQLAAKLEKDIADYVAQLKPNKYKDGWPEDKWEEEMEKHPIFMTKPPTEGEPMPPLVEAMQQLKYDPEQNTPEELARAYKDDGNQYFRVKKYRWAVESYTQGLNCGCTDNELNAQLYTNRAAAHFHIGNFQKALKDVTDAKALKPDHLKALHRGAQCCLQLELFDECVAWCEEGLKVEPKDSQLKDFKEQAIKAKKTAERDKRRASSKDGRKKKEVAHLLRYFKEEGISFDEGSVDLDTLEPKLTPLTGYGVHFDETDCLVWPVLFLYPEYRITDSVLHFEENTSLMDQLGLIFDPGDIAPWDVEKKYKLNVLQVYFGHRDTGKLIEVEMDQPLETVLRDKRYLIRGGLPTFFVTVKNSKFDKTFRKNNGMSI